MSDPGPRERMGERPDGSLSGIIWEHKLQTNVGRNHAFAEGHPVDDRAVIEGYDRTLHPWMHGRRPADLAEEVGDLLYFAGFVIGAALSVLLYGPIRLVETLQEVLG